MNYSDKLIEFLDNELPEDEEIELFSAISKDDSLRTELKSLLDLKSSIKKSQNIYEPSIAMTSALYKELNISLPPNIVEPNDIKSNSGTSGLHFKSMLLGGLATLILLVPAFYFAIKTNEKPEKTNNYQVTTPLSDQSKQQSNENEKMSDNSGIKIIKEYIYINEKKTDEIALNPGIINNPKEDINVQPELSLSKFNTDKKHIITSNSVIPEESVEMQEISDIKSNKDLGLSVEVRGSAYWNLPKETISPSYLAKLNNTGLSVFYDISNNFSIGADLRQETFFVKYKGYKDGVLNMFEQQPNLTSWGMNFRYSLPVIDHLSSVYQINLGMNNYGWILRPMTGFTYNLHENILLLGSLEFATMWFQHDHNWFNSYKIGFNYGIIYNF